MNRSAPKERVHVRQKHRVHDAGNSPTASRGRFAWHFLTWLANALAPALILMTPLISFLNYHRYDLWRTEALISIGIFLLLGLAISALIWARPELLRPAILGLLLVFFLDLQFRPRSSDWIAFLSTLSFGADNVPLAAVTLFGSLVILFMALTWLLRQHVSIIVSSIFCVMIVSTLSLPSQHIPIGEKYFNNSSQRQNLPIIVHLILDEHIGLGGLPTDIPGSAELRRNIETFYENAGFTIFPRAYSQYFTTYESISSTMNGQASSRYAENVIVVDQKVPKYGIRLRDNEWFKYLEERGYRIRIYQNDYVDLCASQFEAVEYCLTVPSNSIHSLIKAQLPIESKVSIIVSAYLFGSLTTHIGKQMITSLAATYDFLKPALEWLNLTPRLGAAPALFSMERIAEDLRDVQPGTAIIAHLLVPHGAYVYDSACTLRPQITSWIGPWMHNPPSPTNSPETRRARYLLYFDQVRCTYKKLGQILDALRNTGAFADSIVIVHGDHGSRISLNAPSAENDDTISIDDLIDSYSTLFAIRRSNLPAGINWQQRSIHTLFKELVLSRQPTNLPDPIFTVPPTPRRAGNPYRDRRMPRFGQ